MSLKGGTAFVDMHRYPISDVISQENAIYIKNFYNTTLKAVKSSKIVVIYNAGTPSENVAIIVNSCNVSANGYVVLRYLCIKSDGSAVNRRMNVMSNDKFYIDT